MADEDRSLVGFVIDTLLAAGHAVFQTRDGRSAIELAMNLRGCDLVISNTRVGGEPGVELVKTLQAKLPKVPFIYVASATRSTPELEAQLPGGVVILREPFTGEMLLRTVDGAMLKR